MSSSSTVSHQKEEVLQRENAVLHKPNDTRGQISRSKSAPNLSSQAPFTYPSGLQDARAVTNDEEVERRDSVEEGDHSEVAGDYDVSLLRAKYGENVFSKPFFGDSAPLPLVITSPPPENCNLKLHEVLCDSFITNLLSIQR